ncbi:MAG TPA: hypothetical protein VKZ87_15170 [Ferrovibrio sp.]|jgi:hypothetical protein|uniref:hypothetical protein n=1 Tax=Ferrovibrio sp. TaxID=1917215 RepID=UPI002B4B5965|nr:hypothetical protein [Ferrovibrio sp.]HLT78723.1 hypothetical protein [Ferrovibrio sp.]
MNLMEATIFAILIAGQPVEGIPFSCRLTDDPKMAICSDDTVIREFADGTLEFNGKHRVSKNRRRELVFTTGVTAHFDSLGWLQFSNGFAARRLEGDVFRLAQPRGPDLTCRYTILARRTRCAAE